jgi:hypothetical protein
MDELQSTRDVILLGIPMLGLLMLSFFRLDHLLASTQYPGRSKKTGHPLSHIGADGEFFCVEPDGALSGNKSGSKPGLGSAAKARLPVRRVTPFRAEKDSWE